MTHELELALRQQISAGLSRRAITSCSKWAEKCRVMAGESFPGPWTFKYHPWTRDMHDSDAGLNVGQKSAQMGYTETMLNRAFYSMDIRGTDVLYVLPSRTPDASDFSASRFDPAIENSPHLTRMFSDTKNVGHKRAGSANLFIRGGRARGGLKSIPVGLLVLDEADEMPKKNIPLAFERLSGQLKKEIWVISTPTIPGFGINELYKESTQNHFFFKCPCCSRFTEFTFPESLVITADFHADEKVKDSHLICQLCKGVLPHERKTEYFVGSEWVPTHTDKDAVGWYINQMYSATVEPWQIAQSYLKGQYNEGDEQEFWNSKMGLAHQVKGAGVTDEDIADCRKGYKSLETRPGGLVTMGVDVGKWLHYEVDQWQVGSGAGADLNMNSKCRMIKFGKVLHFEDLIGLMMKYGVLFCVIDSQPERRKALEFAMKMYGRVRLCNYEQGIVGKNIHLTSDEEAEVKVDRTSWLDLSLGRFRNRTIHIPMDTDLEYCEHIKAQVRVYRKDRHENNVGMYLTADNKEDHYGHARNYSEIALPLAAGLSVSQNITERIL
jgi:hypothetical protein